MTDLARLDVVAAESCRRNNDANWFYSFRRGLEGIRMRSWAADQHYRRLTSWLPLIIPRHHEYELAQCLFGMDSAFECWVFTLNALGWSYRRSEFLSLADGKALKEVKPDNIIGAERFRVAGYDSLYPSVAAFWRQRGRMIRIIMDNHDVSKHRSATFSGGTVDMEPPAEVRRLGVTGENPAHFLIAPMKSVLLPQEPKLPTEQRPKELSAWIDLVELKAVFDQVMSETPVLALHDVSKEASAA